MWFFTKTKKLHPTILASNALLRDIEKATENRARYERERNAFFYLHNEDCFSEFIMNSKTLEGLLEFIPKRYREHPTMLYGVKLFVDNNLPDDVVRSVRVVTERGAYYTYLGNPINLKEGACLSNYTK